MANRQCTVDGCDRPINARGLCQRHYDRWRKTGDAQSPLMKVDGCTPRNCAVADCKFFAVAKSFCGKHYQRFTKTGDPLGFKPRYLLGRSRSDPSKICVVDDCGKPRSCKGYCRNHYYKAYRHGDPLKQIRRRERRAGEGTYNNGYHFTAIVRNGVQRHIGTHRLVMEKRLGRSLRKNENVHHINGNRSDNRPENLELWVRSQPCGQRPVDLVSWAREILTTYESEVEQTKISLAA